MRTFTGRVFPAARLSLGVASAALVAGCAAVSAAPASHGQVTSHVAAAAGGAPAATSATSATSAAAYRLVDVDFLTASRGYGEFTLQHGRRCLVSVAATADGGARFGRPAPVAGFRCASGQPAGALAFDGRGDGFVYGPGLYVTHDGGRTWTASRQRGQVLDVEAFGRSVWMLTASCQKVARPVACPLRLLASGNGGRSWQAAPGRVPGTVPGFDGAVQAVVQRPWIVRTGWTSGYLADLVTGPAATVHGLWFTGDAGHTWKPLLTPCTGMYGALSQAPDGTLFAVCGTEPGAGMQPKTVARSVDGGRSWATRRPCLGQGCPGSPVNFGYLGQIDAVSKTTVFLVGARSPLLVTRDGGVTWQVVRAVTAGGDGGTSAVFFFGRRGIVLGTDNADNEAPALWRTADGGGHWLVVHPRVA